ncbi:ATP-dependent endonuclease [Capnocytophaga leadbetteri]|uniref:AAA family ATPase n=1 Tax=Capnocytophaga leadbetteri TaxID=327575 RepID=UPI0028D10928|nr:ATP-dependent endonuclease [Capnocytophaga leadbetteri]
MKITKIDIQNFRLLKNFSIDLEEELSLVIGKNNTGKTSLLTVLDKFLNDTKSFSYNDFNIDFKKDLKRIVEEETIDEEDYTPEGIKLKIFIEYTETDNLANISRVLMDLDPNNNMIVLGFEYALSYENINIIKSDYQEYKNRPNSSEENADIFNEFLEKEYTNYFKINKYSFEYNISEKKLNEKNFIRLDDENISIKNIINFKYISAKRDVTNKERENTLSKKTSELYKKFDNEDNQNIIQEFKDQLAKTDNDLNKIYSDLFKDVIEKVKKFGGIKLNETNIDIISTLQHKELLEGNTTVFYNRGNNRLPENYNGLGYMNLINMIFEIEIKIQELKKSKEEKPSDINLLFIEEPEAHTHPQMQYVFIKNIKNLLKDGVKRDDGKNRKLQYMITTHSSHIVADSDFDDIKYLMSNNEGNIIAKNLSQLREEYNEDEKQYQFLKQYLTISRAEIFFADKAILIEGDTERILMPTFMKKVDIENNFTSVLPLLSQNISIIEVGAYSQIFEKFISFLGIKALIITDIDSIEEQKKACRVIEGTGTSNTAIKHFLPNFDWENLKNLSEENRTKSINNSTLLICYQQEEEHYHARSFEDAFIQMNKDFINSNIGDFRGLKNKNLFEDNSKDAYGLAQECIDKKTHFALDILYHSDENFSNWKIPAYIKNGLLWLKRD